MTAQCPLCGTAVAIPVQWRPIARDRDGRVVSRLDVPSLTHRCPKEDQ